MSSAPSSLASPSAHRGTHTKTMHSNIDCAIAFVIERGQQLSVPNVFSAYLQTIISPSSCDDDRFATDDAVARAALVTFERAMDKYPMPAPPGKTKSPTGKVSGEAAKTSMTPLAGRSGAKKYSAEVAQLRLEYQQAILRATADGEYQGCSCMSCASLSSIRDRLPMSASEGEDGDQMREPVRVRRRRKVKKQSKKRAASTRAIPFDPYAPSTSAAAL